MIPRTILSALLLAAGAVTGHALPPAKDASPRPAVSLLRVPNGGIQPQAAVDGKGTIHLIYFKGEPGAGDVFYVRSAAGASKFSAPLRVNSVPGSVVAIGNVRGAHLALGKNGRAHVAWMGSRKAEPKAPGKQSPMLYARLNDAGSAFEPQRNAIRAAVGLDGGGSVAADGAGNVYVVWHAPSPGARGEGERRVWVARSSDEGRTFAEEKSSFADKVGACGCCGMRAFADKTGALRVLFRSAKLGLERDTWLLTSTDKGASFRGDNLGAWKTSLCPMSTYALAESAAGTLAAWETKGQVSACALEPGTGKHVRDVAAPGAGGQRKHPAIAGNARGEVLLAWTEGMGWERGGAVAWQVFDKAGKPTAEKGRRTGVPVWSVVAAFARPDGGFTIVY